MNTNTSEVICFPFNTQSLSISQFHRAVFQLRSQNHLNDDILFEIRKS